MQKHAEAEQITDPEASVEVEAAETVQDGPPKPSPQERIQPKLMLVRHFFAYVWHRFGEDRCVQHASALAYTSLLSLVPLMAVTFTVLAAFPVFENFSGSFQDFVFENFVPASGEVVQNYLQEFVQKASGLTAAGIVGLVVTALMLMASIDKAFNSIWRTNRKRSTLGSFMVYWAVLSLGPMLMGAGIALSSYVVSLPLISDAATLGRGFGMLRVVPFLLSSIAFTLLYMVVPTRRVLFRHALGGGVLAALLFEGAKKGFAFYVTNFPGYEAIYGALATMPIFLVWIYLSWMVALLGAEVAQALSSFRDHVRGGSAYDRDLHLAYRLIGHLWQAQQLGKGLSLKELLGREPKQQQENIEALLDVLDDANYIHFTEAGEWLLARDLNQITLADLYQVHGFVLTQPLTAEKDPWDQRFVDLLQALQNSNRVAMSQPLVTLYRDQEDQVTQIEVV